MANVCAGGGDLRRGSLLASGTSLSPLFRLAAGGPAARARVISPAHRDWSPGEDWYRDLYGEVEVFVRGMRSLRGCVRGVRPGSSANFHQQRWRLPVQVLSQARALHAATSAKRRSWLGPRGLVYQPGRALRRRRDRGHYYRVLCLPEGQTQGQAPVRFCNVLWPGRRRERLQKLVSSRRRTGSSAALKTRRSAH
jgi:hypothetical protein